MRSRRQQEGSERFREAVAYARAVLADPERKAAYQQKVKRRQSVYRYAVKEYMKKGIDDG